jgi:hypothetical protein
VRQSRVEYGWVELFDGAYEPISLSNDLLLLADVD